MGCTRSKKMHVLGVGAAPPTLWMLFKSRPPRLLFSELVTLVTVTGEDVTLAPRGPFITSFYVNQPFTQGGGSPACLGFKTSGTLGVGERKPYKCASVYFCACTESEFRLRLEVNNV